MTTANNHCSHPYIYSPTKRHYRQPTPTPQYRNNKNLLQQVKSKIQDLNPNQRKSKKIKENHLVAPEDRQTALAALAVDAGLLHHALQDGERGRLAVDVRRHGQLDAGLVVVLRPGHGGKAGALAGGVVEPHADLRLSVGWLRVACCVKKSVKK